MVFAAAQETDTLELTEENIEKVLDEVSARWVRQTRALVGVSEEQPLKANARSRLQVRPYLMADGGNVEFVEIDGLVVKLRLQGACGSCPSSTATMTMGIKRRLMEKIPVRGSGISSSAVAAHYAQLLCGPARSVSVAQ